MDRYFHAAVRLHQYLLDRHWDGTCLRGPDPGVRLNYRMGRFIKSYLQAVSWHDNHYYLQAQGYWVLGNWYLFAMLRDTKYAEIARRCSDTMISRQRDDGAWDYPNPEWKGRVTNYEGTWAAIGLLDTYRHTSDLAFLKAALRWKEFLVSKIGFQRTADGLAANYFANHGNLRVPNNSAFVLRFFGELADVTGDPSWLNPCAGLLTFMRSVQKETGEFPYAVSGTGDGKGRSHFQCYQYNAFQCLDMMRYHQVTRDTAPVPLISKVLQFLRGGLANDGHALYECGNRYPQVSYHTAVLGAAFSKARELGLNGYDELSDRAYSYLLGLQKKDGSFPYSRGDYYFFSDRRSYPRHLAMILYHLSHSA